MSDTSVLYIVPTPIGNLGDITLRALEILKQVDLIAAEDTRHTGRLLSHLSIQTPTISLHDHNEQQKAQFLVEKLKSGQSIALVSDAGTPLISDPGYHLVQRCRDAGVKVIPLPGACAAITALSASGLPTDRFCFEGFLPPKGKALDDKLESLREHQATLIFYESPRRVIGTVEKMVRIFGPERPIVVARELSKCFETITYLPAEEMLDYLKADEVNSRGEIVLMVGGASKRKDELSAESIDTLKLLCGELPLKKAAALVAKIHQVKKNQLYQYALVHFE